MMVHVECYSRMLELGVTIVAKGDGSSDEAREWSLHCDMMFRIKVP